MKLLPLFIVLIIAITRTVSAETSGDTLRIGLILPLSGEYARLGTGSANAANLANTTSFSTPTASLELFFEDNRTCAALDAVTAYKKLTSVKHVGAIITFCTAAAKAVLPLAKSQNIPVFQLTEPGSVDDAYMIKMMPIGTTFVDLLADEYAKRYDKMAIIADDIEVNTASIGNVPHFTSAFQQHGKRIVFEETFPSDTSDFRSLITRIRASHAQSVIPFIWNTRQMAAFLKQADEQALWNDVQLAGNFVFEMMWDDLSPLYPRLKTLDGLLSVNFKNTTSKAFNVDYQKRFHDTPPQFSDYAFDVISMIRRCRFDRQCLLRSHEGASGFNEFGPDGRRKGKFALKELRGQRFIEVSDSDQK